MIFVTVGTQLPFDRLVMAVDEWAKDKDIEVFAQTGETSVKPKSIKHAEYLKPSEADKMFREATLIVSHAGVGSILSALKYKKPILILPRRASLGEHRNEHQLATAKWVGSRSGINVAWDENELIEVLNSAQFKAGESISDFASPELIYNVKAFIAMKDVKANKTTSSLFSNLNFRSCFNSSITKSLMTVVLLSLSAF